jgi:hypothetical protein
MQPDLGSSHVERPTTASAVDPGELSRTVRPPDVMPAVVDEPPPRVDLRS